jgi:hypothetical protein
MNYIASYYKNLCEQLQEKINLLEAQIYSPEGKFLTARKARASGAPISDYGQGLNRKVDVQALRTALEDKSHPIHQNPEHVAAVRRVLADIDDINVKSPGNDLEYRFAQHVMGEKINPSSSASSFGSVRDYPSMGRALPAQMRIAVDVMRGRYGQNSPETTIVSPSTQY